MSDLTTRSGAESDERTRAIVAQTLVECGHDRIDVERLSTLELIHSAISPEDVGSSEALFFLTVLLVNVVAREEGYEARIEFMRSDRDHVRAQHETLAQQFAMQGAEGAKLLRDLETLRHAPPFAELLAVLIETQLVSRFVDFVRVEILDRADAIRLARDDARIASLGLSPEEADRLRTIVPHHPKRKRGRSR